MATLELFYDFVSPYSYFASTRVEALAARTGATLRFRPFLLGGVLKATDNKAPADTPAKYAHLKVDTARWAKRLGVPFRFPTVHPFSTVLAMRCALAAEVRGQLVPFTHAAFRAAWAEDRDLTKPEVLAGIASSVGLDGPALVAAAPDFKAALVANTEEAVRRGSFGAPSLFVGDELFVGNDRLDFVEEALRGA
ncbi:2-hydroxychromene-2-carboxylate isomerase [Anaeromyxobacter diazotrophicus]|uniref:2-hydroxychromene-2-carboxylate isomerase n=1 Tax=Anaeromyxobacter diazotrophicus TaxID=2590199 RepID=A0A7I9VQM6_9BACT|nr:2-hydroxychromene-2-carboxylate isomerase [Anaeromyxobacter diazotrophicus]GEJ58716.1 2-hydroxychromene-2-carboxylate isomerase [Anaeromyxobacter diazotrophicus]